MAQNRYYLPEKLRIQIRTIEALLQYLRFSRRTFQAHVEVDCELHCDWMLPEETPPAFDSVGSINEAGVIGSAQKKGSNVDLRFHNEVYSRKEGE